MDALSPRLELFRVMEPLKQIPCGYKAVALRPCPFSLKENGTPQEIQLHGNREFGLDHQNHIQKPWTMDTFDACHLNVSSR